MPPFSDTRAAFARTVCASVGVHRVEAVTSDAVRLQGVAVWVVRVMVRAASVGVVLGVEAPFEVGAIPDFVFLFDGLEQGFGRTPVHVDVMRMATASRQAASATRARGASPDTATPNRPRTAQI